MLVVGESVQDVFRHVPTPQLLIVPAVVSVGTSLTLKLKLDGALKTSPSVPVVANTMVYGLAVVRS